MEPLTPGHIADVFHFPLFLAGAGRCFVLTEAFMSAFLESGYTRLGKDVMRPFLKHLGFGIGKSLSQQVMKGLGVEGPKVASIIVSQGKALGWWDGVVEIDIHRRIFELTLRRNWEAEYSVNEALKLKGGLTENSCITRADEFCRFML